MRFTIASFLAFYSLGLLAQKIEPYTVKYLTTYTTETGDHQEIQEQLSLRYRSGRLVQFNEPMKRDAIPSFSFTVLDPGSDTYRVGVGSIRAFMAFPASQMGNIPQVAFRGCASYDQYLTRGTDETIESFKTRVYATSARGLKQQFWVLPDYDCVTIREQVSETATGLVRILKVMTSFAVGEPSAEFAARIESFQSLSPQAFEGRFQSEFRAPFSGSATAARMEQQFHQQWKSAGRQPIQ